MPSPSLSIANNGGSTNDLSQVITGTVDGIDAGSPIFIYDNGADTPIGSTSVAADHTWCADVVLTGPANHIVARTPYLSGSLSSNPVDFVFEPVLSPPSNGQSSVADAASIVRVGSAHHLSVWAEATPEMFVFGHHPGHIHLAGLDVAGPDHDRISLPASGFSSVAELMHHIHPVGHSAVLSLGPHDTITFANLTAHALKSHVQDFHLIG